MDSKVILFLVLSILIIFLYPAFLEKMGIPVSEPSLLSKKESIQHRMDATPTTKEVKDLSAKLGSPITKDEISAPATPIAEVEQVIETDLYKAVLSNVGGTIKRWELKNYTGKDETGKEHQINLIKKLSKTLPLELCDIKNTICSVYKYSMAGGSIRLNSAKKEATIAMVAIGPEGEKIRKELRFYNDDYRVDVNIYYDGPEKDYVLFLGNNFGINEWGGLSDAGAIGLVENDLVKVDFTKVEGKFTYQNLPKWSALHDKYFIGALIINDEDRVGPVSVFKNKENEIETRINFSIKGGEKRGFSLYAGPKEYERLSRFKVYLEESIDFGWFITGSWLPVRLVAKPLFYILQWLYQLSHNYGVSIILLTVFVKALFFPLTKKSLMSMKAMAAMQPKVAAIRKQWEKNKEKMNKELMNLYKEEKINPLGGCLPMLLQMPIFISLFNVLSVTIELRHAPFMLWVQDLSDKDPYYVLPVIMGASMFLQQLTQPNTMDPVQAKIMLFLPVIYTFSFLNFPSGLVLYWLVNNILSIAQQYMMNREGLSLAKASAA